MTETLNTPADAATEACCGTCRTAPTFSRRAAIGAGLVTGAAVLAGCASDPATPTSSAPATTAAGNTGTAALTTVDAIPDGGSLVVGADKAAIAFARKGQEVVAFSAVCTHQGCTVAAAETSLNCPCHGSTFDAFTGEATKGPATVALSKISITVEDGNVLQA